MNKLRKHVPDVEELNREGKFVFVIDSDAKLVAALK